MDEKSEDKLLTVVEIADDVVKKALGILDATQRAAYVCTRLTALEDHQVVEIIHQFMCGAAKRYEGYRDFLESGIDGDMLKEQLGRFKFSRIYHFAKKHEYLDVIALFTVARAARTPDGDEDKFLVYGMADRTVGERKYLARSLDKEKLDKIGYDLNPIVIRQLLINPRLTEIDVVKIAARRPNYPEVLEEIYKNKKWLALYQVKKALVANPYTPPRVAFTLLPFLMKKDMLDMSNDGMVAREVQLEARKLYKLKLDPDAQPDPEYGSDDDPQEDADPKRVYSLDE